MQAKHEDCPLLAFLQSDDWSGLITNTVLIEEMLICLAIHRTVFDKHHLTLHSFIHSESTDEACKVHDMMNDMMTESKNTSSEHQSRMHHDDLLKCLRKKANTAKLLLLFHESWLKDTLLTNTQAMTDIFGPIGQGIFGDLNDWLMAAFGMARLYLGGVPESAGTTDDLLGSDGFQPDRRQLRSVRLAFPLSLRSTVDSSSSASGSACLADLTAMLLTDPWQNKLLCMPGLNVLSESNSPKALMVILSALKDGHCAFISGQSIPIQPRSSPSLITSGMRLNEDDICAQLILSLPIHYLRLSNTSCQVSLQQAIHRKSSDAINLVLNQLVIRHPSVFHQLVEKVKNDGYVEVKVLCSILRLSPDIVNCLLQLLKRI